MERSVKSTCCYCGVGCGIIATRDSNGTLRVEGDPDHPVNRGQLCSKGRSLHHVVADVSDRITAARMRAERTAPMRQVTMGQALDHVSVSFQRIIAEHGPDAVGFYVSGQFLTEEYYLANKLMKGFIGSNNIDTNSRLCMSSAAVGYKKALGGDCVPVCYEDIDHCNCFLVSGANPAWCHPILWRRVEARMASKTGARLIAVDPRRTETCSAADLHLQILPGTDVILNRAIARLLVDWDALDHDFLRQHCEGVEDFLASLESVDVAEACRQCGVSIDDVTLAARWIAEANTFMTMWTMGLNQSKNGTDKNLSILNLSLLTGQIGKKGSGPFSLTGQPNAMGGREVGGLANLLAVHLDLDNDAHREQVADFWGVDSVPSEPGLTATEMIDAMIDGRLKAVWIMCTNPAVSLPNLARFEKAMAAAELVVVQEISERSDTVAYADVVLPAAAWLEKTGTMTNCERRIARVEKLLDPPGDALPDAEILLRFAKKMGWGQTFSYDSPADIYAEYAAMTKGTGIDVSGLSYERLAQSTVQWPCPENGHPGTPRLFTDFNFPTASGKARLHAVSETSSERPSDPDFPLILTTGRVRDQWHTRTKTGKVSKLDSQFPEPFLEIHPSDAEALGLKEGDPAQIDSMRGRTVARTRITDRIRPGVVFLPMHWGKMVNGTIGRGNNVTSSRVDPFSKQPDYKYTAVSVQPYTTPKKKVVIVGAGAAALEFIQAYREVNQKDELVLFGREPRGFYNRVLLPDYIVAERSWQDLVTLGAERLVRLGIDFRCGREVLGIDRASRQVLFAGGRETYDKLVLCTGSRPFIPPGTPMARPGLFSIRTREDAEAIIEWMTPGSHALVIGGGLLGIEMAAAFNLTGVDCTVIELGDRLMARQLDKTASALLKDELEDRGIEVICGDRVVEFEGEEMVTGVTTAEGRHIRCDPVIVAVGTRPNIERFTGKAGNGLVTNRGLVVDAHLRTSDLDVYALGEIAEFEGTLFGITRAAQEQGRIAAHHCAGDPWSIYRGSVLFNILKIHGRGVASAGLPEAPEGEAGYEEVSFLDRRRRIYKKCVIYRDRMVGCTFIGDTTEFTTFRDWIEQRLELDDLRDGLLQGGGAIPEPPKGRIVCSCNQIGEGNLRDAIHAGADTLETLCSQTRAGTGCGSCRPELQILLEREVMPTP